MVNSGRAEFQVGPGDVSAPMVAPDPVFAAWHIRSGGCTYTYDGPDWTASPLPASLQRFSPAVAINVDADFNLRAHAYSDANKGAGSVAELNVGGFPLMPRRDCAS